MISPADVQVEAVGGNAPHPGEQLRFGRRPGPVGAAQRRLQEDNGAPPLSPVLLRHAVCKET